MKYILMLLFAAVLTPLLGQPQSCHTPDRERQPISAESVERLTLATPEGILCSKVFVQVDYDIVEDKGIDGARVLIEDLCAQWAVPYSWIDVELSFDIEYLTSQTYTEGNSYQMLQQFQNSATNHTADIAMMLSYKSSGGIAWVDQACKDSSPYRYSFSSIQPSHIPYLVGYSWNPEVTAHEAGHLYGCGHTQDNVYTINGVPNQPIDGCYPNPGGVVGPIPTDGGTIMSYCHLRPDVGINFEHGFHPIHAAIIRASVYNRCTTCDTPDGPDDPEPPVADCELNTVFIDVHLDAWPEETSYLITDADGDTVYQSRPYTKDMRDKVMSDTLCFFDGCYTFKIEDVDGLGPDPVYECSEGMFYVGDPFGEFGSGQTFTTDTTVQICLNVEPPANECVDAPITDLVSYSIQDRRGYASTFEQTLTLSGNNWKAGAIEYTTTDNTMIVGQVRIDSVGEIHGIGLVKNIANLDPSNIVRFGGTQRWGLAVDYIELGEWVDIAIPIGQWIEGSEYTHIVYVNDFDQPVEAGSAVTKFRNIELCENGAANLNKVARPQVQGKVSDEDIGDTEADMQRWIKKRIEREYRKPYPNPVDSILTLDSKGVWFLYTSNGPMVDTGFGGKIDFSLFPAGIYFLYFEGETHKIVKK